MPLAQRIVNKNVIKRSQIMEEESDHAFEEESFRNSTVRRDLHEIDLRGKKVPGRLENGKLRDPSGTGWGVLGEWEAEERGAAK